MVQAQADVGGESTGAQTVGGGYVHNAHGIVLALQFGRVGALVEQAVTKVESEVAVVVNGQGGADAKVDELLAHAEGRTGLLPVGRHVAVRVEQHPDASVVVEGFHRRGPHGA